MISTKLRSKVTPKRQMFDDAKAKVQKRIDDLETTLHDVNEDRAAIRQELQMLKEHIEASSSLAGELVEARQSVATLTDENNSLRNEIAVIAGKLYNIQAKTE